MYQSIKPGKVRFSIEKYASLKTVSRITIELNADAGQIQLIAGQLRKLISVRSVKLLSPEQTVRRELMLMKHQR